ncbi:MAG TPA: hypothetical protein VHB25_18980 [Gemmatimonadaceae bacterium]|nr:hypothetical protein [Gemmatimonadaceae bacterium]
MLTARADSIAMHVEAAKRLLQELEQHAQSAVDALGREGGAEFVAAVSERERVLAELNDVVEALAHERAESSDHEATPEPATGELFAEMARVAAAALEAHENLLARTRMERDRLAALLHRTNEPDRIASRYAGALQPSRGPVLSVTG